MSDQYDITQISDKFVAQVFSTGLWPIFSFFTLVILLQFNGSFVIYSSAFTAAFIPYNCSSFINKSLLGIDNEYSNELTNHFIKGNSTSSGNTCSTWSSLHNQSLDCPIENLEFYPDEEFVSSSLVSHFRLVCGRKYLDEIAQSLLICGLFLGGIIGPFLGDKYGRQRVTLISTFATGVIGTSIAFVNSYYLLAGLKCLLGFLREISMCNGYVLAFEFIPSNYQSLFGMLNQLVWCVTLSTIGCLAYFVREWHLLQIIGSCPALLCPFLLLIVSESPRWLISKGYIRELKHYIKNYVIRLNTKADSVHFDALLEQISQHHNISSSKRNVEEINIKSLLKSKYLCLWSFILIITWMYAVTAVFSMNNITTLVAGNPYFNFFISSLIDSIGVIMAYLLMKISRNSTVLILQSISAICFIFSGFLTDKWAYISTVLIIIGKCSLTGILFSISITALYIYPSNIRSFGSTFSCAIGKLFAMVSPYYIVLYKNDKTLAGLIMGIFSVIVGIINLFYPDWLNRPFPETIADAEKLKDNVCFSNCRKRSYTYSITVNYEEV